MRDDGYTYEAHLAHSTDHELWTDREGMLLELDSIDDERNRANAVRSIYMIEHELMKRGIL